EVGSGRRAHGRRRLARSRAHPLQRHEGRVMTTLLHAQQQARLFEKLRRELGPVVLGALEDPEVTEVMANPDGALWVESQTRGMRDTGTRLGAMQGENLIGTVAAR